MFNYVYHCLLELFKYVYQFLLVFTYVHHSLLLFNCLLMFTRAC